MGDKTKGIHDKFEITRVDGSSAEGGRHHGCDYFTIDMTHDPYAAPALLAYADACAKDHPLLAADLRARVGAPAPDVKVPWWVWLGTALTGPSVLESWATARFRPSDRRPPT